MKIKAPSWGRESNPPFLLLSTPTHSGQIIVKGIAISVMGHARYPVWVRLSTLSPKNLTMALPAKSRDSYFLALS